MDIGKPESIITDHGTQFKGKRWREEMLGRAINTYKTSIYYPSSNPAERVLRELGRILRTYCHDDHKRWSEYITDAKTYLNLSYHETLGICPYQLMFTRPPPRKITKLIKFPEEPQEEINLMRIYNRVHHHADLRRRRQNKKGIPVITYENGEKIRY